MTLDELVLIVITLGGVSSILTAVVTRAHWAPWLRLVASVAVSALVGCSGYLSTHDWHVQSLPDVLALIIGIVTASWIAYQNAFKPLGITAAIEQATTPASVLAQYAPAVVAPVVAPVSDPAFTVVDHGVTTFNPGGGVPPTKTL